jgi:hypothetical protein
VQPAAVCLFMRTRALGRSGAIPIVWVLCAAVLVALNVIGQSGG